MDLVTPDTLRDMWDFFQNEYQYYELYPSIYETIPEKRTPKITMAIPPIIESSDAISMNYTFHFLKLGIPMDLPTKSIKIPFYMILLNFLSLVYFLFVKKGVKSQKNVEKQSKNHFPTIFSNYLFKLINSSSNVSETVITREFA